MYKKIEKNTDLDIVMKKMIKTLGQKKFLEENCFHPDKFYQLYEILERNFVIPKTSITKIMSRMLFSIGYSKKPRVMVGAGTYTGHALAWLSGYHILGDAVDKMKIYGLDISAKSTEIAKKNFSKISTENITLLEVDAIKWLKNTSEAIDLLYIDIDTKEDGKRRYTELLDVAYPKMSPDSLIIAHDTKEEIFKNDMKPFLEGILDESKFKSSINLSIDPYGLSITIKR